MEDTPYKRIIGKNKRNDLRIMLNLSLNDIICFFAQLIITKTRAIKKGNPRNISGLNTLNLSISPILNTKKLGFL